VAAVDYDARHVIIIRREEREQLQIKWLVGIHGRGRWMPDVVEQRFTEMRSTADGNDDRRRYVRLRHASAKSTALSIGNDTRRKETYKVA
jgi:hypothetical protein